MEMTWVSATEVTTWALAECIVGQSNFTRATHVMSTQAHELSIIERIERALVLLAYFIELDGDVHLPMYEKFEAELEAHKEALATRERARRRLATYKDIGEVRLIP